MPINYIHLFFTSGQVTMHQTHSRVYCFQLSYLHVLYIVMTIFVKTDEAVHQNETEIRRQYHK